MPAKRVTITLPPELLHELDRRADNRSLFVQEALRREIARRRRRELERSLGSPHPESIETVEMGLAEWDDRLQDEEAADLVDPDGGTEVRWSPGDGWNEDAS